MLPGAKLAKLAEENPLSLDEQTGVTPKVKVNPNPNARKIYVASLPPSINEKPLRLYFQAFGDILVRFSSENPSDPSFPIC